MGVRVGARRFQLDLPDEDRYAGVTVVVKGLTIGEALEFGEFLDGLRIAPVMNEAEIERRDRSYALFVSRVLDWNLEDQQGEPLPKTLEGMHALDWEWGRDFIRAWTIAVSGVPSPLERPSTDGEPLGVELIPMESP